MKKLSRNTILVTGGTSGIGLALASQLLDRGNVVLITGRSAERLDAVREALPGVHAFVCDQSDPAAIERLFVQTTTQFPKLNIVINNAGIGLKRNLNDTSVSLPDLEREIRANLIGPIQINHRFLDHLKAQESSAIVNVTSGLAFVPLALKPIYSATKAALHSYTMSLRAQLKRTNVRVFEIAPPATDTDFNKGQEDLNSAHLMKPGQVAKAAIAGIESGRAEVLPGAASIIRLLGRLMPKLTLRSGAAERWGVDR